MSESGCGCPTIPNGDMRCHVCGEYVNVRCWNCKTPRGEGPCPNPKSHAAASPSVPTTRVGSVWRRNPPGREVVRVERVWTRDGERLVRAHPVRGGKVLIASVEYLTEHYTQEAHDG